MSTRKNSREDWDRVYTAARKSSRASVRVDRRSVPHPRDAGARPTASWPAGQITDHAMEIELGAPPLTVREFNEHFEAFVDTIELSKHVVDAIDSNPRAALLLAAALLGGAFGSSMTNKREGALVGAGVGVLLACMRFMGPCSDSSVLSSSCCSWRKQRNGQNVLPSGEPAA